MSLAISLAPLESRRFLPDPSGAGDDSYECGGKICVDEFGDFLGVELHAVLVLHVKVNWDLLAVPSGGGARWNFGCEVEGHVAIDGSSFLDADWTSLGSEHGSIGSGLVHGEVVGGGDSDGEVGA